MRAELELRPTLEVAMRPSAALVSFAEMLALPATALEDRVERELDENPALEQGQAGACPLCEGLATSGCPFCAARAERPAGGGSWVPPAAGVGAVVELAAQPSAAEELRDELRLMTAEADRPIVEYLVASLDGRGRLDAEPGEVAVALGVEPDRVDRVLGLLRAAGPPGVGGRDLRECLLLQLDRWERPPGGPPLVREIVERHLAALGAGRYRAIAEATGHGEARGPGGPGLHPRQPPPLPTRRPGAARPSGRPPRDALGPAGPAAAGAAGRPRRVRGPAGRAVPAGPDGQPVLPRRWPPPPRRAARRAATPSSSSDRPGCSCPAWSSAGGPCRRSPSRSPPASGGSCATGRRSWSRSPGPRSPPPWGCTSRPSAEP